ncbi:hypothetical protein BB559_000821, partial [Furculomyces boomerangus]
MTTQVRLVLNAYKRSFNNSFQTAHLLKKKSPSIFSFYSTTTGHAPLSIGIRREDKNRWERRSPLTPAHVSKLIQETKTKVYVQPSKTRVYNDLSYERAGATISEDLSKSDIILGIKEVPISKIIPNKTYAMFSHTHKGQAYNARLLQTFLDKNIRIVDYELIRDPDTNARLVMFGKFAGYVGMLDGIHGLGQRMLARGFNSPFINVGLGHVYPLLNTIKFHLQQVGDLMKEYGVPKDFGPVVFTITGSGNVAKGAQEILECLPHEYIKPSELADFVKGYDGSFKYLNKVFGVKVTAEDYSDTKKCFKMKKISTQKQQDIVSLFNIVKDCRAVAFRLKISDGTVRKYVKLSGAT